MSPTFSPNVHQSKIIHHSGIIFSEYLRKDVFHGDDKTMNMGLIKTETRTKNQEKQIATWICLNQLKKFPPWLKAKNSHKNQMRF